jgi:hypothetical protein
MLTKVLPLICSRRSFHTYEKVIERVFWVKELLFVDNGGALIDVVKK